MGRRKLLSSIMRKEWAGLLLVLLVCSQEAHSLSVNVQVVKGLSHANAIKLDAEEGVLTIIQKHSHRTNFIHLMKGVTKLMVKRSKELQRGSMGRKNDLGSQCTGCPY